MGRTEARAAKMNLLADVEAAGAEGLRHDGGPTMAHLVNGDLVDYNAESDRYQITSAGRGALALWGDYGEEDRVVMMRVVRSAREEMIELLHDSDPEIVERLIRDELIYVVEAEGYFTYLPTPRLSEAWAGHSRLCQSSYYRARNARSEEHETEEMPAVQIEPEPAPAPTGADLVGMLRAAEEKSAAMARVIDDLQAVIQRQQAEIVSQARTIREQERENNGLRAALSKRHIDRDRRDRWDLGA